MSVGPKTIRGGPLGGNGCKAGKAFPGAASPSMVTIIPVTPPARYTDGLPVTVTRKAGYFCLVWCCTRVLRPERDTEPAACVMSRDGKIVLVTVDLSVTKLSSQAVYSPRLTYDDDMMRHKHGGNMMLHFMHTVY